jgi:hypothetical protein
MAVSHVGFQNRIRDMLYYARINGSAHPHGPPLEAVALPSASWWHDKYCFWSSFPHQPYEIEELRGNDDEAEKLLAAYNVGVALAGLGRALGVAPPMPDSVFVDAQGNYDVYAKDRTIHGDTRWPPRGKEGRDGRQ